MRRFLCIFVTIFILISLCSCDIESENPSNLDGQKEEYMPTVCTKDSVDEFLAIAEGLDSEGLLSGYSITRDNIYNVTPVVVAQMTDYKIFKTSDSCASFIMIENEIYPICQYFGGYGFVNALPCDFDSDGCTDLLVASSFGSGIHCSVISIFNGATKQSNEIYTTNDHQLDLIVMAQTPSFSSVDMNELPIYYVVYSVDIKVNDNNLANLSYVMKDVIGSVKYENDEIIFKPTDK